MQQSKCTASEPGYVSGFDVLPGFAHAKIAYLWAVGDETAVAETWRNYTTYSIVASQVCSTCELAMGEPKKAFDRQVQFVSAAARTLAALPESIPVLGHVVATAQSCSGNRRGKYTFKKATRSCSVLMAGSAIWAAVPTTMPLATATLAGLTGVAAGIAVDRLLVGRVPRPLTNAEGFDMVALRILDMIRAMSSFHYCFLFTPSHITEVSVWVQPITLAEMSKLVHLHKYLPAKFGTVSTEAVHAYMLVKTHKGELFVTEKMHDGHVLVENFQTGITHHFQDGHELGTAMLDHATNRVDPLSEHVAAHAAPYLDAEAPLPTEVQGASLFAARSLKHGPSTAILDVLAKSQSILKYDVFLANCQHYVGTAFSNLTGSELSELPNNNLLALAKGWATPEEAPPVPEVTLPVTLNWSLREGFSSAPQMLTLEAMLAVLPVESLASAQSKQEAEQQRHTAPQQPMITDVSTDAQNNWQDQFAISLRRRMPQQHMRYQ